MSNTGLACCSGNTSAQTGWDGRLGKVNMIMNSEKKGEILIYKKGLIQIFTGNGKGKTTAALGQAIRAIGHGYKVLVIQFMKGDPGYGEIKAVLKNFNDLTIVQSGLPTFVKKGAPGVEDLRLAREGLDLAWQVILGAKYDLLILDEINVAMDYGLLEVDEVYNLLQKKPPVMGLILTGRYVPPKILELADMISEVHDIKHHYYHGVAAQPGVEY
jgi:cob(I)alamin adenosyltransferase